MQLSILVASMLLGSPLGKAVSSPSTKSTRERGFVIIVGGIGGVDPLPLSAKLAFPCADVEHCIYDFRWTHGVGRFLRDLQDIRHLRKRADELAKIILRLKARNPCCPIYLVGHSAGTGIVLFATEHLPPKCLERIVLLASAVSPTYDLRPALRATKREIVSFYSPLDFLVLGWGTSHFGTVDRIYGRAAGFEGFCLPERLPKWDRELYRRLIQVCWKPGMLPFFGGLHNSSSMPLFLAHYVAPWLR